MLLQITLYEIKYRFSRISTHLYFAIMFLLGFLMVNAIGGVFDGVNMAVLGSGTNLQVNSPYVTMALISVLSTIGIMITASFMGQAVYKDFDSNMDPLLFTTPITEGQYLGGRFIGALLMNLYIFLGIGFGLMVASFMPWVERDFFGAFRLASYAHPYYTIVIPNLLFTGSIFFTLAVLTRQMLPNYVGGVVLFVGYLLAGNLISDMENETIAALIDPFGGQAFSLLTNYWTLAEQNANLIPMEGLVLYNRLLWVGVGVLFMVFAFLRFSFSHQPGGGKKRSVAPAMAVPAAGSLLKLPEVSRSFSLGMHIKQYVSLASREFWNIVRDVYFYAIIGAGVMFLIFSASQVGSLFGTTTYPVTYSVLDLLGGSFSLFMLIIITFYAGELVWRERDLKSQQIYDALPVPNWVPYASKFTALSLVCVVLLAIVLVVGVMTQAFKGYFNFEIGLYLTELYGVQLIDYILLCVLAITVQVIVNHKYMGHMVMVIYYLFNIFMGQMGLEHTLYDYGSDVGTPYSDMNGYGHFTAPFSVFKLYWAAFALLLASLTNLLWVRGQEGRLGWRFSLAKLRVTRPLITQMALSALIFVAAGGFIFYNTNVLNTYQTSYEGELKAVSYEAKYKQYEQSPQPRITDVYIDVDIYPEAQDVLAKGYYIMKNKTSMPIDSVHLNILEQVRIDAITLDQPNTLVVADPALGYYIYDLAAPLLPGDSLRMDFDLAYISDGFANSGPITQVVYNGTFFNSQIMPGIGYKPQRELAQDDTRKKHDLPLKERMPAIDDSVAMQNTYITNDADWVNYETIVSTVPEQIAIAPGYLQREWTEEGRKYYHYKMDAPIMNFYSYLSAEYAVARDTWNDVSIEVFYHPGHAYNIDRMIDATKKSLEYFSENFSPYQHRQLRILEFPRYASFAQSFPNTIPFSESVGFIAKLDEEDDIDYPFYVTAHEIAHQWWAHQVIGANVQGATVMSETMSQYSALMVMEEEYGEKHMRRFLQYEMDNYLSGRSFERKKENPLILNENQQYIHYNKGSVVMYALKDYIGEDSLNMALSRYIDAVAFQEAPYTTSREFLGYIRAVTPDTLQYVLDDMFENITLYGNRVEEATYEVTADSQYVVNLTFNATKMRADSLGNENEISFSDWIDVGVFADEEVDGKEEEVVLYLKKHKIKEGENVIELVLDQKPLRAGIDPYNKLIDRNPHDNVDTVSN